MPSGQRRQLHIARRRGDAQRRLPRAERVGAAFLRRVKAAVRFAGHRGNHARKTAFIGWPAHRNAAADRGDLGLGRPAPQRQRRGAGNGAAGQRFGRSVGRDRAGGRGECKRSGLHARERRLARNIAGRDVLRALEIFPADLAGGGVERQAAGAQRRRVDVARTPELSRVAERRRLE